MESDRGGCPGESGRGGCYFSVGGWSEGKAMQMPGKIRLREDTGQA